MPPAIQQALGKLLDGFDKVLGICARQHATSVPISERHDTCRQDKSQLVRAGRRPLRGVFLAEDVSLQIGQVHHSGGVSGHPRGRDDLVGDEGRPDGLPFTASARPAIGVAVAVFPPLTV